MVRLASAAVMLLVLWVATVPAPPLAFVVLALAGTGAATWECSALLGSRGGRPLRALGVAGSAGIVLAFTGWFAAWDPTTAVVAATIAVALAAMGLRAAPAARLAALWTTAFPLYFVALTLGHLVALRCAPAEHGQDALLLLFLLVILGDSAAYYAGSQFGRRRLAPVLSPRKTWEGAIAGVAASVLAALLARVWFYRELPLVHALALGLVLGVAAIAGDLAESLVKRASQVKDSSGLIPGHGGVLDRTDSLLFAGPILYHYWRLFLQEIG